MVRFKRGSSFRATGIAKVSGVVQDMSGWTLECQVRAYDPGTRAVGSLIATLPAGFSDPSTAVVYVGDNSDTSTWPLGFAVMDLKYTAPGGQIVLTSSEILHIEEGVTRP